MSTTLKVSPITEYAIIVDASDNVAVVKTETHEGLEIALPDGRDLGRSSPEFEGEGLSVAECHIFAPFPLKLSNLFPGCLGTKTAKQRLLARLVPFAGTPAGRRAWVCESVRSP